MEIEEIKVTVRELTENYSDNGDDGVFGLNNKLVIRPPFQREFVYGNTQMLAVIDTVRKGFPLNVMYWTKNGDKYEVLDGQQRTISIARYVTKKFPIQDNGNDRFFHNLTKEEQEQILDYKLTVYLCEGTALEKLEWFRVINTLGEQLNEQELLNASYTGSWLSDAKIYFSKRNCVAVQMSEGYMTGKSIRQEYLSKVLKWIADRDDMEGKASYMAVHQDDKDANDLWVYFQTVINWAKILFPEKISKITDKQEWGLLYNKYHTKNYNSNKLKEDLEEYIDDDDVTNKAGIIPYLLSDQTRNDEKYLSIRAFTDSQKKKAYKKQQGKCALCSKECQFSEMQGDHIEPWSKGGRTIDSNLQMLCRRCNNTKKDM